MHEPAFGLDQLPDANRELFRAAEREIAARVAFLPDKPEETPAAAVAALWHLAAGTALSLQAAVRKSLPALDARAADGLRALIAQRIAGTPIAHLTGRQHFMGLELLASPSALIPRRETELLGNTAVERLQALVAEQGQAVAVDVCTGSGNLAVAMAHQVPEALVWGSDLSPEAVDLARRNAVQVGVAARLQFRAGDLLEPLLAEPECRGKTDLLVCNPPYISSGKAELMADEVRQHEPRLAFDGGPLGIRILQQLINDAPALLRPGGWLAFEVGLGQGRGILQRLQRQGRYSDFGELADERGQVRVLTARCG